MPTFTEIITTNPHFSSFGGADQASIEQAEKELCLNFSEEYKDYLLKCGAAIGDGFEFTGITDIKHQSVVDTTKRIREQVIVPSDWYVVEEVHIDGLVIWQDKSGKVYQTIPGAGMKIIANSLYEYIQL